ncbi:hypothetical protein QFZ84_002153, partial [Pseudomonas fluorescens]
HKHPHELLDSVVKERLVKIFRLNRGAHSTAASVAVKRLFSEVFKVSFATSTTCASDLSLAGGEFYSVTRCCQHLFFSAFDRDDRTVKRAKQHRSFNSLGLR